MTTDFTLRDPAWISYSELIDANSDKFYEARVDCDDDGTWYLTKRWGRRPATRRGGQSKVESFPTRDGAIREGKSIVMDKRTKGYEPTTWPLGEAAMPDFHNLEEVAAWLDS